MLKDNSIRVGTGIGGAEQIRKKPIVAYKFIHSKDLHYWLTEKTIKIDTLYSFSSQEAKGGVGDPLEVMLKDIRGYIGSTNDPQYKLVVDNLYALGICDVGHGEDISIISDRWLRKNRFVYCLSASFDKDLFLKWNKSEGYDTVIKIKSVLDFGLAVQQADYNSSNLFEGNAFFNAVEYIDMPVDLSIVDLTKYKFIKDAASFSWQKELRFSWPAIVDNSTSPYFLHIPELNDLIEVCTIPCGWMAD